MMKSNTSERLNQIMQERNIRQSDILEMAKPYCVKYGIRLGRSDLSQYVTGKTRPGQDKLAMLGFALNVSEAWLMGYDVPMERDISDYGMIFVNDIIFSENLTAEEASQFVYFLKKA